MATKRSANASKLVSVICRTIGRPTLQKALLSVASQTYHNVEIVLVDAAASGNLDLGAIPDDIQLTRVTPAAPLARAAAANAGLDAAKGDYLMFLDDDDWIAEEHLALLVPQLEDEAVDAVYSSTRRTDPEGNLRDAVFNEPFDRAILRRDNFIPIHSMLFSATLLQKGCRFDESLDTYEDWDFWLQVAQHTDVRHIEEITAFYRDGGASETGVTENNAKYINRHPNAIAREKVFAKWLPRWSAADLNQTLGSLDREHVIVHLQQEQRAAHAVIEARDKDIAALREHMDRERQDAERRFQDLSENYRNLQADLQRLDASYQSLRSDNDQLIAEHRQLESSQMELTQRHQDLIRQHQELDQGVREILNSFSWRITKPYRVVALRFSRNVISPLRQLLQGNRGRQPASTRDIAGSLKRTPPKSTGKFASALKGNAFTYSLDSPSAHNCLFSDSLLLQGWALANSGAVNLTVYIDGLEFRSFSPSYPRPDVAREQAHNIYAENCGFFEKISLEFLDNGRHTLKLAIWDKLGNRQDVERSFYLFRGDMLYGAWFRYVTRLATEAGRNRIAKVSDPAVHMILTDGGDIESVVASILAIARQHWADWHIHYVGGQWAALQDRLAAADCSEIDSGRLHNSERIADCLATLDRDRDFLLALEAGDILTPNSVATFVAFATETGNDIVYSDHDELDAEQRHVDPVFTPDWSPEHFLSRDYVGGVFLMRATLPLEQVLPTAIQAAWRYALLLELSTRTEKISRTASVLWSRHAITAGAAERRAAAETGAIEAFLQKHGIAATVQTAEGVRFIDWQLESEPRVSIIMPTTGNMQLLQPCLNSLLEKTSYSNYEVIMLDNSRGKHPDGIAFLRRRGLTVVDCDIPFNWARLNNIGARHSSGDLLLFLNDDIEITDDRWLHELVKQAQRPEIGAVGSLLLYPNGAIQHAGVFLVDYGGGGLHLFHRMMPDARIYQRLDTIVREVSANTGACLMLSKEKFAEIDGFDEELAVVGNDVDLCLRLLKRGYRNIWTPRCKLIHHESISRKANVPKKDETAMWRRWGEIFTSGDKYYNPNLTLEKWDCSLRLDIPVDELLAEMDPADLQARIDHNSAPVPGVNLFGYIRAEMGLGEGARSDARALTAANVDFGIINFETGNPGRMTDLSWRHKEILNAPFDINLLHINADFLPLAKREFPSHFFKQRYNIGYWAWELETIPEDWLPALEEVDEIWVPSDFVKSAIQKVTSLPVITIPHCVEIIPTNSLQRDYFGIPANAFVFLAMFDSRSIAQRKNPMGAIEAFKSAFANDDDSVCLVLKVNNANAEELATLTEGLKSYSNVVILDRTHTRQQIDALLSLCDCYVSLHRSEGFGLVPAEAMCLGKATILTNWSGSVDYMTAENCLPIDYELVTLMEDFGPYKAGQRWAEPDLDAAATAMRRLATEPELASRIGAAARETIAQSFSPAAVGRLIAARLDAIREQKRGEIPD